MWQIKNITVYEEETAYLVAEMSYLDTTNFTLCPGKVASLFHNGELIVSYDDQQLFNNFAEIGVPKPSRENIDLTKIPKFRRRGEYEFSPEFEPTATGSMTLEDRRRWYDGLSKYDINRMDLNLVLKMVEEYFE